jgi:hypothetical protein
MYEPYDSLEEEREEGEEGLHSKYSVSDQGFYALILDRLLDDSRERKRYAVNVLQVSSYITKCLLQLRPRGGKI